MYAKYPMAMKLSRCPETEEQAKTFLRGLINIVNPLGEHNRTNYWSYDETDGIRSTRSYDGDRRSCCSCNIRRVLNSGLRGEKMSKQIIR